MSNARTVYVAMDNVDELTDDILGILGNGRRMTLVRRWLDRETSSHSNKTISSGSLEVQTGLTQAYGGPYENGIKRVSITNTDIGPAQKGLIVQLDSSFYQNTESFSFVCFQHESPDRDTVARRYHDTGLWGRRDLHVVRYQGFPGQSRLDDQITIEYWNGSGVGRETTIAFEDNGMNPDVEAMARELLDIVDYGRDATSIYWSTPTVLRACHVLGITPEEAKAGLRRAGGGRLV